jgi:hypothetical protein
MSSSEAPQSHHADLPRRGGAVAIIALVLSLIAVGLSAWTAFRPAHDGPAEATHTTAEESAAKLAICRAADVVRKGVSLNTNLQSPGGEADVTGALAVAANARLSLSDGGQYLIARLDPAVPKELADAVKGFANTLLDIGAAATAGSPNTEPDQAARLRTADSENAKVAELCK